MMDEFGVKNTGSEANEMREQALNDTMQRGVAFEELMTTKGWEFLKAYYENKVRVFGNKSVNGFDNWDTYQVERGKVQGLREMFSEITSTLETLRKERELRSKE